APDELYRGECERCQRALQTARNRHAQSRKSLAEEGRDKLVHLTKAVLPSWALDCLRARRTVTPAELDPAIIKKYSTDDFFYRSDNLDEALDLIAFCRVA